MCASLTRPIRTDGGTPVLRPIDGLVDADKVNKSRVGLGLLVKLKEWSARQHPMQGPGSSLSSRALSYSSVTRQSDHVLGRSGRKPLPVNWDGFFRSEDDVDIAFCFFRNANAGAPTVGSCTKKCEIVHYCLL